MGFESFTGIREKATFQSFMRKLRHEAEERLKQEFELWIADSYSKQGREANLTRLGNGFQSSSIDDQWRAFKGGGQAFNRYRIPVIEEEEEEEEAIEEEDEAVASPSLALGDKGSAASLVQRFHNEAFEHHQLVGADLKLTFGSRGELLGEVIELEKEGE